MDTAPLRPKSPISPARIIGALALLLAIAIAVGFYFYRQSAAGPQEQARAELDTIVARVGRLMVLPAGETPTLATVSDPEKLKDQPFFANATKGDKVLIYPISRKAILYSPTLDRIVEISPVSSRNIDTPNEVPLQTNE